MFFRFLLAASLLLSTVSAQDAEPPILRVDLVFITIQIGGPSPGIGLQPPRVGIDIWKIAGVSVGVEPAPAPPPPPLPPIDAFAQLEGQLAEALEKLNQLIQAGASPQAVAAASAECQRIAAQKAALGPLIAPSSN